MWTVDVVVHAMFRTNITYAVDDALNIIYIYILPRRLIMTGQSSVLVLRLDITVQVDQS